MSCVVHPSTRDADDWLDLRRPHVIVVDVTQPDAQDTCLRIRQNPRLANVAILALTDVISDLTFEDVFGWGADDLAVRDDEGALVRRLRALARVGEPRAAATHGTAIVADAERRSRILTARVLRNAGYAVSFALDGREAIEQSLRAGVELVVSASELETEGQPCLAVRAREAGATCSWVVAAPPKEVPRLRAAIGHARKVSVYDRFGASGNVLFVANETAHSASADEGRATARVLYGASIRFRPSGAEDEEIGYTYNISGGGVYVRTLVPLPRGSDAWIELRPPRSERRVHLEGRVVWTRGFGPTDTATVPPGFGLQICGSSFRDLEHYARGYRTLAADVSGP
jgi:DNA-binding response OmpR family regulator